MTLEEIKSNNKYRTRTEKVINRQIYERFSGFEYFSTETNSNEYVQIYRTCTKTKTKYGKTHEYFYIPFNQYSNNKNRFIFVGGYLMSYEWLVNQIENVQPKNIDEYKPQYEIVSLTKILEVIGENSNNICVLKKNDWENVYHF